MFVCVFGVTLNQVLLDEGEHEAEQCQHLDECQTQEHEGLQTAAELRLASGAFDGLADQDAQTDARADGGEAVANAFRLPATSARVTISMIVSFLVIA